MKEGLCDVKGARDLGNFRAPVERGGLGEKTPTSAAGVTRARIEARQEEGGKGKVKRKKKKTLPRSLKQQGSNSLKEKKIEIHAVAQDFRWGAARKKETATGGWGKKKTTGHKKGI